MIEEIKTIDITRAATTVRPHPFPLEAVGPELAGAAQAIRDVVQAPIEMCASAVLASASFAVTPYINITCRPGRRGR
jgi:hypothetical protein